MSYCQAAQREGKCKEETFNGLWRTIDASIPFLHGEFPISFSAGKMYISDFQNKTVSREVGDIKKTGSAEKGGIMFEVTNWKADSKIWPHDKMYGVYSESTGEAGLFNFLQLAISDKPIQTLS